MSTTIMPVRAFEQIATNADYSSSEGSPSTSPVMSPVSSPKLRYIHPTTFSKPPPASTWNFEESIRWKTLEQNAFRRQRAHELPMPQPFREFYGTCQGYAAMRKCQNSPATTMQLKVSNPPTFQLDD